MSGTSKAGEPSADHGIHQHDLGRRLRAIRRRQGVTLKDVAGRAGISESFLSQIERALTGVSLPVLQRIASTLGVSVADLFEPDEGFRPRVLRHDQRPLMEFEGWRNYLLTPRPLQNLEVFWIELEPDQSTADRPFSHGNSEEVFILMSGEVEIRVGGTRHELHPGDSIVYSSASPHAAHNIGTTVAEAIIVLSPPSI